MDDLNRILECVHVLSLFVAFGVGVLLFIAGGRR